MRTARNAHPGQRYLTHVVESSDCRQARAQGQDGEVNAQQTLDYFAEVIEWSSIEGEFLAQQLG